LRGSITPTLIPTIVIVGVLIVVIIIIVVVLLSNLLQVVGELHDLKAVVVAREPEMARPPRT
jgi:hypothetical protein